jgi:hypothetical protein
MCAPAFRILKSENDASLMESVFLGSHFPVARAAERFIPLTQWTTTTALLGPDRASQMGWRMRLALSWCGLRGTSRGQKLCRENVLGLESASDSTPTAIYRLCDSDYPTIAESTILFEPENWSRIMRQTPDFETQYWT